MDEKIIGYRELSQTDIDLINSFKQFEDVICQVIDVLQKDPGIDQRWLAIGKTDIQKGVMALVRSVAQPGTK